MNRTPLTPDEQTAVKGLTDKERPQVWRLFIRYRRQINVKGKSKLLEFALNHSAPDFRKRDAVAAALAKIETIKAHNSK